MRTIQELSRGSEVIATTNTMMTKERAAQREPVAARLPLRTGNVNHPDSPVFGYFQSPGHNALHIPLVLVC